MIHFEALFRAVKMDELPAHPYRVYVAVVSFYNHTTGRCDPSIATIAKRARLSKTVTKDALKALQELNLVLPRARRIGGVNLSNAYFLPGVHDDLVGRGATHLGHEATQGGVHGDLGVGRGATPNKVKKQRTEQRTTSSRSREVKVDLRYGDFVKDLQTYWKAMNGDLPFDFDDKDGKALKTLLTSKPSLNRDLFEVCLQNRGLSEEVNHCKAIYTWLPQVTEYAGGPLNKYGKPKGESNGDRTSQSGSTYTNRGQHRVDVQKIAAAGAYQDLVRGIGEVGNL